jgi:microtubule-associated protein, RP/EB family
MRCEQHVDVPKLCRAKPLDNLEFLQWIKRYFDLHFGGHEYNALERRGGKGAVPLKENDSGNKPAPKVAAVKNGAVRVATSSSSSRPASAANKKTAAPSTVPALCCSALLTLRRLLSLLLLLLAIICP